MNRCLIVFKVEAMALSMVHERSIRGLQIRRLAVRGSSPMLFIRWSVGHVFVLSNQ